MLSVCVIVLVDQRARLSAIPFSWGHLKGGLTGLSAGFPLALYMFIGWENGPALAEEARDPRRTIPRALYLSVAIGAALFVFFAYATVTGFHYDVASIGRSSLQRVPVCRPGGRGGGGGDRLPARAPPSGHRLGRGDLIDRVVTRAGPPSQLR